MHMLMLARCQKSQSDSAVCTRMLIMIAKAVHVLVSPRARGNLALVRFQTSLGLLFAQTVDTFVAGSKVARAMLKMVLESVSLLIGLVATGFGTPERFSEE